MGNIKSINTKGPRKLTKWQKRYPDVSSSYVEITNIESGEVNLSKIKPEFLGTQSEPTAFYNLFIMQNENLIGCAETLNVYDLGNDYDLFFDLGFTISQQPDGKIRDKSKEKYFSCFKNCLDSILDSVSSMVEKSENVRGGQFQAIIDNPGILNKEDMEYVNKTCLRLNSKKLEKTEQRNLLKSLASEINEVKNSNYGRMNSILTKFSCNVLSLQIAYEKDMNSYKDLPETYSKIPDTFRARFMKLITHPYLESGDSYYRGKENDIAENLLKLNKKNAEIYIDFLDRMALNTKEDEAYNEIKSWVNSGDMNHLVPKQKDMYFMALNKLMESECYGLPTVMAIEAAAFSINADQKETMAFVDSAIKKYDNNPRNLTLTINSMQNQRAENGQTEDAYTTLFKHKKSLKQNTT